MYICVLCACLGPWETRRRHQNPLELDLHMFVSCYVGAGDQPRILGKEQLVLLTTEPSLWPQLDILFVLVFIYLFFVLRPGLIV